MSVDWVQDANGNYEISSAEHILQLMHEGALFTDTGTPPTLYIGSGTNYTSYIQTADIDLASHHANIQPIGITSISRINYDGNFYKISNWSYSSSDSTQRCGLFRYRSGGELRRIRLSGVWTLNCANSSGFLSGWDLNGTLYDIEADFSPGTSFICTIPAGNYFAGLLVGSLTSDLYGITIKGTVTTFQATSPNTIRVGGIAGRMSLGNAVMCRNLATFPNGIISTHVGGLFGWNNITSSTNLLYLKNCLNAMTGDLISTSTTGEAGGIVGYLAGNFIMENVVNSMQGNITSTGSSSYSGGIIGTCISIPDGTPPTCNRILNYMTGDISGNTYSALLGRILGGPGFSLTNSIVAMNGTTGETVIGSEDFTPPTFEVTVDDSFGLTYTANTRGSSTLVTDSELLYHPDLPNLPYFLMEDIDPESTSYKWDFIYGNMKGNASYSLYSHLVLHKENIEDPILVSLDIPENNTTLYATFLDVINEIASSSSLTVISVGIPLPLSANPRPILIHVKILHVDGAIGYNLTYEGPTGGEITSVSDTIELTHNIADLEPETMYTIRLYVDTGSGYVLTEFLTTTTLPDISTNYDASDFKDGGVFKLTQLPTTTFNSISGLFEDLFNTGDVINAVKDVNSSFINLGESLNVGNVNGVLIPFKGSNGAGQTVTMTLSDTITTTTVSYNDTVNSITIDSVEYFPGDVFVLDGKKITIVDI